MNLLEGLEASFFAQTQHVLQDGCLDILSRQEKKRGTSDWWCQSLFQWTTGTATLHRDLASTWLSFSLVVQDNFCSQFNLFFVKNKFNGVELSLFIKNSEHFTEHAELVVGQCTLTVLLEALKSNVQILFFWICCLILIISQKWTFSQYLTSYIHNPHEVMKKRGLYHSENIMELLQYDKKYYRSGT